MHASAVVALFVMRALS